MSLAATDPYGAYRNEVCGERMVPALRNGIAIVVILTAGFIPLDWISFRSSFVALVAVRGALFASFGAFWLVAPRAPERTMLAALLVEGLHLVAVIGIVGGVTSPYYPGLMLLFLGMPVLLPLTARQAAGTVSILFASFAALPLLSGELVPLREYLINIFFPAAAAIECVASTALLDKLRFQDFVRRREIEAARDELAQLDELKTRFSANVHHELRTPLTLMLAPLDGLLAGDYGGVEERVGKTLRTMHSNGQRLLKLINNLLDLAKLESKQFEIRRAALDLGALIATIVDGATPMAERKQIALTAEGIEGLPSLFADRDAIEKVIVNLLGNALKFTNAGGTIAVGAQAQKGGIEVRVHDSGAGLEASQLERIFDRFAQADSPGSRRHEGTGIGLSLAQELVQLHGGRIWAESEGLGQGATMRFFLPFGEADAAEEEPALATDDGRASANPLALAELERTAVRHEQTEREIVPDAPSATGDADDERSEILVVDDNQDMRELISFILGREFRVRTARNGREALDVLASFVPDLVVSDIMMPELSGTELCRAVKSDARLAGVPVMLVSSKAESDMKIEGLELGADDYVTKPFHPRELLARARSHAALRRARRELEMRNEALARALHDLRVAEAQLVQAERLAAIGELAAGVAHEVNNPVNYALNAVRAMAGLVDELCDVAAAAAALDWSDADAIERDGRALRDRLRDAEVDRLAADLGELAKIVSGGLERTHRLVVDLRDFAAPGSAGEHRRVDLRECVRATAELVSHDLDRRGVVLALALPESVAQVEGDPGAINQVLLNLVKNAAEAFAGAPGSIAIEVFESDGEVAVGVRDDGPGIEAGVMARLFEPFFTTKPAGSGTGLGLAMCRRIAESHRGRIEVESELGVGSCFTLRLPARAADEGTHAT